MRNAAWVGAIAMIALARPGGAQRAEDSTSIFPELRSARVVRHTPSLITRPFIADLHVVLVRQTAVGELVPVTARELAVRRLTRAQAFALALRNLRRRLVPFGTEMPDEVPEMSGMRSVDGKPLEPSRLLLDDEWREAAAQLGGPVVATAPVGGMLLFGRDTVTPVSRKKSVSAAQFLELAAGVLMPYRRSEILSAAVLRWTDAGWQVVPPMTERDWAAIRRADEAPASAGATEAPMTTAPTAPAAMPATAPAAKATDVMPPKPTKPVKPGKP